MATLSALIVSETKVGYGTRKIAEADAHTPKAKTDSKNFFIERDIIDFSCDDLFEISLQR